VAALGDRWRSPARLEHGHPGAIDAGDGTRGSAAACGGLLQRDAGHVGMGTAVMPGQDLTEAAGPVFSIESTVISGRPGRLGSAVLRPTAYGWSSVRRLPAGRASMQIWSRALSRSSARDA
jgi:hypothetical protein